MIEKKKSINFDNNLYNASLICEGRFCNNREFSRIYSFATENVSGYIDYFNFNDKSLLTVGSSGDQILNAFYNGESIDIKDLKSRGDRVILRLGFVKLFSFNESNEVLNELGY